MYKHQGSLPYPLSVYHPGKLRWEVRGIRYWHKVMCYLGVSVGLAPSGMRIRVGQVCLKWCIKGVLTLFNMKVLILTIHSPSPHRG